MGTRLWIAVRRYPGSFTTQQGKARLEPSSEAAVAATTETASSESSRGVAIRCWGTRGSIPSPGPATAEYGGNTSCLSVRVGGNRFIFDAGTGIRLLGAKLDREREPFRGTIFLTHFHWDHIQGFPFFSPLYDPETRLEILGPRQKDLDVETIFGGLMSPVYFPVPFDAVAAELAFHHMNEDVWERDGVRVRSMRVRHPSYVVGYRLDAPAGSLCYIPDSELVGGDHPVGSDWRDRLLEFVGGVDVLFHDAMFTGEEYRNRAGWGHSTFRQALDLAAEGEVDQLYFFHHAPERSDSELNSILQKFRNNAEERGLDVAVNAAFEGKEIRIEEK